MQMIWCCWQMSDEDLEEEAAEMEEWIAGKGIHCPM